MEGLYVAATLQVPMLPSLDSHQIEVMFLCPSQALRAHADMMGGAGPRCPAPPWKRKEYNHAEGWKLQAVMQASLAQLAEHALRTRMVTGSIPVGGFCKCFSLTWCVSNIELEP